MEITREQLGREGPPTLCNRVKDKENLSYAFMAWRVVCVLRFYVESGPNEALLTDTGLFLRSLEN